jgi:hypothetical protein
MAILAFGVALLPGQAQEKYPERPIRLVVPLNELIEASSGLLSCYVR